jgi:predicted amidophosphoribosyltransferase
MNISDKCGTLDQLKHENRLATHRMHQSFMHWSDPDRDSEGEDDVIYCPDCKEPVEQDDNCCPYCGNPEVNNEE